MKKHWLTRMKPWAWLVALIVVSPLVSLGTAVGEDPLPWALRDTYKVNYGDYTFSFAGDWGEWKIEHIEGNAVIETAQARIILADGRSLYPFDAGKGSGGATRITESDFGTGITYSVVSPNYNGVQFTQSVSLHRGNPFLLLRVAMTNMGDAPIEIAEINPAMFSVSGLGLRSTHGMRHMRARGPYLGPDMGMSPFLGLFTDPDVNFTLAVGTLPLGRSESTTEVSRQDTSWQVTARNVYRPTIQLEPGDTIESDPVWISFSIPRPSDVDMYYTYAHSQLPRPESMARAPRHWISVPAGSTADDLYRAVDHWARSGIRHALVPALWQDASGALEGARPAYPRQMSNVASSLRGKGVAPGLTIDPLLTDEGDPSWSVSTDEGQTWINPSHRAARSAAVDRLQELAAWGFEFFAVEASLIPDDVLRTFNLTRKEADALAFEIMADAAGDLPVVPTAALDIRPDLTAWLNVSGATSRLREYGMVAGPVRFDATGIDRFDDALLTAMMFYGGSIEFKGVPSSGLVSQIARIISAPHVAARPLSIEQTPRQWQVHYSETATAPERQGIVLFPDAPALDLASHGFDAGMMVWRAEEGELLQIGSNPLPATDTLTFLGMASAPSHPLFVGLPTLPDALFQSYQDLQWDADTKTLSGRYTGGGSGHAFVALPPGWQLESAQINERRVRLDSQDGYVAFEVSESGPTRFTLVFSRG